MAFSIEFDTVQSSMPHFIWVFTDCLSTRLGVSGLQRIYILKVEIGPKSEPQGSADRVTMGDTVKEKVIHDRRAKLTLRWLKKVLGPVLWFTDKSLN